MKREAIFGAKKIEIGDNLSPIPEETVEDWKNVPVKECGEPLVPVGAFSTFDNCDTEAYYFNLKQTADRKANLVSHFVRVGVLEKLKVAQGYLPKGYYLRLYDTYRPLEVQREIFDGQKEKLRKLHPDWDEGKLDDEVQRYVTLPSPNTERETTHPSPHSTGGVIDLTIIKIDEEGEKLLEELERKKKTGEFSVYECSARKAGIFKKFGVPLNMGADFDHFEIESQTRYLERLAKERELTSVKREALRNRRFLYAVLKKAGFTNYPEEWWHWSFGDSMNAVTTDKNHAIYGGVMLSDENVAFENTRRQGKRL